MSLDRQPVVESLSQVNRIDVPTPFQIGHRSSDPQNPIASPGAEAETADEASEQCLAIRSERTEDSNLARIQLGVAAPGVGTGSGRCRESMQCETSRPQDTSASLRSRPAGLGLPAQIRPPHGRDLDPQVEPIAQRPADARCVSADHPFVAGAATG